MPPNEEMLAAALERLQWAAQCLRYVDVARQAVEKIEAAATDRYLAVGIAVTLTTAEAPLAEAWLILKEGKVALQQTSREGQDFDVLWLDLEPAVRDDVAHALPALADALAAPLLARAKTIKRHVLQAQNDGGSTDV